MKQLLRMLSLHTSLITFVLLELVSISLIRSQHIQDRNWGHGHHRIMGACHTLVAELRTYPTLKRHSRQLQQENACLQAQLQQARQQPPPHMAPPTNFPPQYALIPACVVNNALVHTRNYLTIDRGAAHGLAPDMGVIGPSGIVGKIKAVSERYATVVPLLHVDVLTSAKLAQSGVMGTVQWPGHDPFAAQMHYVPQHVSIAPGEAVVTSGYNAVFFEGIPIGHIKRVVRRPESPFYDIELSISTDFSTLQHVYVVVDTQSKERKQLEQHTRAYHE